MTRPTNRSGRETVVVRAGWIPSVVREDGELRVELGAGADALHQPRTFSFPIAERHLQVIRDDLARHLLLWCAVLPLCDAAGTTGPLDEDAAVALLDPILFGPPAEVDALVREVGMHTATLVAHGADTRLLERGQVLDSLGSATEQADWGRAQAYDANCGRARRGVHLAPIDEAVLRYTGQYLHGATRPGRHPEAVEPGLLPVVLRVVATAEQASAGMRIRRDPRRGKRATDKRDWTRMGAAVGDALRREHPALVDDVVRSVRFLVCAEAADRAQDLPVVDDADPESDGVGGTATAALVFTDDRGAETTWRRGDARSAGAEFWEFVADHAGSDNEVFTIEDEALGEGIQLHLYADSIARITTVATGDDGADPEYRVEYRLVDGMDGYRVLVSAFTRGGCAALAAHGPWTTDPDELERLRREAARRTTSPQDRQP